MLMSIATMWMSGLAFATVSGGEFPIEPRPVLEDRLPQARISFASNVEALPDIVYSTPPGYRPLRLDLYRPQDSGKASLPLVVYVHGGGWQSGHTRHSGAFGNWPGALASLASRGYVVASIEYRLSGEARFPAAIQDVKTSIRWLRSQSGRFGIDSSRVIVWGGSAGGQLAALAATSCGVVALAPLYPAQAAGPQAALTAQSDCVQGLVTWYGVFDFIGGPLNDLANRTADSPVQKYLGCAPSDCKAVASLASPITHLDRADPPALLIHGDLDSVVPVAQSRLFDEAMRKVGAHSTLLTIDGVDHSFVGSDIESTRAASLKALSATFEFIDAVTRSGRSAPAAR